MPIKPRQACTNLTQEELQSFFSFVNKTETCWLWKGPITKKGYGQATIRGHKIYAYRASFIIHNYTKIEELAQIEGFCVCHSCGIKTCVNPDHLYLGTAKDNFQDWLRQGHPESYFLEFLTKEQIREIISIYPYTPNRMLATKYGVTYKVIHNLGNTYKISKFKSFKIDSATIVDNNKDDIIKLFQTTAIKEIAKIYGVPKAAIYKLIFTA